MKRLIPKTIPGLIALTGIVLLVASLIFWVSTYHISHEALEAQLDQRVATESHVLEVAFQNGGVTAVIAEIGRREARSRSTGMGYILEDAKGLRLAGVLNAKVPKPGWEEFLYDDEGGGVRGVSQALTVRLNNDLTLVVAADRTPIDRTDAALFKLFGATFAAMLLIGIGCAWGLGLIIRQRLQRINDTAQAIIDGDHSRRIARDGTASEFDRLAETLNRMLDRNAELLENLRQVSSDIAHDLRTPLSRLQQVLDGALNEARDVKSYRLAMEQASERSHEILELFSALLRISEIESLQIRKSFRRVDLSEITERVADAFRPDLETGQRRFQTDIEPAAFISGDQHLLSQMVVNLIENTLRHTPDGTALTIRLVKQGDQAILTVADNGPGIAEVDREFVLRRFARLEQSRSEPGYGLGLSLVTAIAQAHHSQPMLTDNAPGLKVQLTFQRA
jgi:signal transduction histidine kinase